MKPPTAGKPPAFPSGHFYSPVVDVADVEARRDQIWPTAPDCPGIDFDDASHRAILSEVFPRHIASYDYPDRRDPARAPTSFYSDNPAFGWLDSRLLFVLLREWRPRRMIEVGSGYSTLLAADVNARFLSGAMELTCIEPHPPDFLRGGVPGLGRLIAEPVQRVSLDDFTRLENGDVLFIDSSHVAKTGSDVNHLLFEVLPRLAAGVRIHFHDIFLPHEYPPAWVLDENRSWNEQYAVRALLLFSSAFRVVFGSSYAYHRHPELVRQALGADRAPGGGSLWLERVE